VSRRVYVVGGLASKNSVSRLLAKAQGACEMFCASRVLVFDAQLKSVLYVYLKTLERFGSLVYFVGGSVLNSNEYS
jgi:hypothetical protein